ncbi:GGDEF domain-containing protein [Hyphomicrobium sp. D-2]|uniref:GGDEF domain-containing protein n=1 Tax=Hyphomicrobium sp. D-2 TaxID=3041621 RepID=UPI0024589B68|nr:GGDEF domain-containing protein [Hyphomicrobium sp. D-2]MDH4983297.1 GGDEF domain-containing protein [Hyphomicrobium sp. D-2]
MWRAIASNPWTSLHDALLVASIFAVGLLLCIEFDLFYFAGASGLEEQRVTVAEAIGLTCLLAICVVAFVIRRLREVRVESERAVVIDQQMQELRKQALRDPLTDLANRRAVLERLNETHDPNSQHAFFLLDLNDFKSVNDTFGHTIGDSVLQVVAERFKRITRPSDILARLGGDEFAMLVNDVDRAGAEALGARLLASLSNRIWVDGIGHDVGVSIGIVFIPSDGVATPEILSNADIAMYRAKKVGKSAMVFFGDLGEDAEASTHAS